MKTNLLKTISGIGGILFFLLSPGLVYAQKIYVWDEYKLQITVPSDFWVKKTPAKPSK
jgi:hypothetical protein